MAHTINSLIAFIYKEDNNDDKVVQIQWKGLYAPMIFEYKQVAKIFYPTVKKIFPTMDFKIIEFSIPKDITDAFLNDLYHSGKVVNPDGSIT